MGEDEYEQDIMDEIVEELINILFKKYWQQN